MDQSLDASIDEPAESGPHNNQNNFKCKLVGQENDWLKSRNISMYLNANEWHQHWDKTVCRELAKDFQRLADRNPTKTSKRTRKRLKYTPNCSDSQIVWLYVKQLLEQDYAKQSHRYKQNVMKTKNTNINFDTSVENLFDDIKEDEIHHYGKLTLQDFQAHDLVWQESSGESIGQFVIKEVAAESNPLQFNMQDQSISVRTKFFCSCFVFDFLFLNCVNVFCFKNVWLMFFSHLYR